MRTARMIGLSWRLVGVVGLFIVTVSLAGLAQEDEGIELLREGSLGVSGEEEAFTAGPVVMEPVRLKAAVGYVAAGSPWIELGAATTMWVGNVSLTASAVLHGLAFSLDLEGSTQMAGVGLTAGARFTSSGLEFSGGFNGSLGDLAIGGHASFGREALVANISLSKEINGMRLAAGAGWSGGQLQLSTGVTVPAGPLSISAAASLQGLGNIVITGGLHLRLIHGVALFGNVSLDGAGIRLSGGAMLNLGILELSATATQDAQGLGFRANGRLDLGRFALSGAFRMDSDSQSYDLGGSIQIGQFLNSVTIGLDPQGFKWIQFQIETELRLTAPRAVPQDE